MSGSDVLSATPQVRVADLTDLPAVAEVFAECWRRSYAALLADDVRDLYDLGAARELWRGLLTPATARGAVLVARPPGRAVSAVVRFGADPDDLTCGHIFSLYAHPDAQRLGLGRLLLDAALARLTADGYAEATLWVFAANGAARGFYQRLGWRPDGGERVDARYREPELRLRHPLAASDSDSDKLKT